MTKITPLILFTILLAVPCYADDWHWGDKKIQPRSEDIQAELDRMENVDCVMNTHIGKVKDWRLFTDKELDKAMAFSKEQNQVMYIRHDLLNNTLGYAVPYYATAVVSRDFRCKE